jgi:hypothetical protein
VIEASSAVFVDVRLPQPARYQDVAKATMPLRIEGGGDYVRFELHNLPDPGQPVKRTELGFLRMGSPAFHTEQGFGVVNGSEATLPTGTYRLYVHTTAPTRMVLTIPGRSGTRVFRPDRPALGTESKVLEPITGLPPGVSAIGGSGELKSKGEAQLLVFFEGAPDTADRIEWCLYPGGDESAVAPYRPGCPQGSGFGVVHSGFGESGWISHAAIGSDAGRFGLGMNVTHAGDTRRPLFGMGAWTSFDDDKPIVEQRDAPVVVDTEPVALPAPSTTRPVPPLVRLRSGVVRVRKGRALVKLSCPAGGFPCTGSVAVGRARAAAFSIHAGRSGTVRAPLVRRAAKRQRLTIRSGGQTLTLRVRLKR